MQKNTRIAVVLGVLAFLALFFAYYNHFNNPFELDDSHTILDNTSIRKVTVGKFFSDATTSSYLPPNQAYRPGLTTLNAIDYAMWSKSPDDAPQPLWFHVSIFITFAALCFFLYFFYKRIFDFCFPEGEWNYLFALFCATFFGLHTANAETINYIIARADSFSTLMVVLCFLIYMKYPALRKTQLFLIPMVIGFFVKEPTIMFAPLLFLFIFLFEENNSLTFKNIFSVNFKKPLLSIIPALIIGTGLVFLSKHMTPSTWSSGAENINPFKYFLTNFFSIVHYLVNFILPFNLAVDTDWKIIERPFDDKVIVGLFVILTMIWIAVKCSLKKETKAISFGILWFFITLIPTSTLFAFAEPNNDHRPFFGYIGLVLAVGNLLAILAYKWKAHQKENRIKYEIIGSLAVCLLISHFFGVRHRNNVWSSEETLWKDAAEKCPNSGRIWMNYGLPLMRKGDLTGALESFNKAKEKWPYYPYVYINLGIIKNLKGETKEAEADYISGIQYGPMIPDAYSFYGNFLLQHGNARKADSICNVGLTIGPNNLGLLNLRAAIDKGGLSQQTTQQPPATLESMKQAAKANPTWENWLNLSLAYYNAGDYKACIEAANEGIKVNPNCDNCYNNVCTAYNMLQDWDNAIIAGQNGLKINPNNQLLVGNLRVALENKMRKK